MSVLGSALLMVPGVCIYLPYGSLIRHNKADIVITLRDSIGQAVNDVGMLFP